MSKSSESIKSRIASAKRIVVKAGTNVIMRDDGALALGRLYGLIESIAGHVRGGREILMVSSGAVGLGSLSFGLDAKPKEMAFKQACAAAGQGRLMAVYQDAFAKLGIVAAQVLLTEEDFSNRVRYLNLRAAMNKLIELGAVPVINENDVVSTLELETSEGGGKTRVFGDNDKLSALVMSKVDADLLVLLSDVDGLFTKNPARNRDAVRIPVVERITPEIEGYAEGGGSRGRGGMRTKIDAARIATQSGGLAIIANGRRLGILDQVLNGEDTGTVFLPRVPLAGKRRWIAYAATVSGTVTVNDGAKRALLEGKASLLPAGVTAISGEFSRGDVVEVLDSSGRIIARGQVNYAQSEALQFLGKHSAEIEKLVEAKNYDALITRNHIVISEGEEG